MKAKNSPITNIATFNTNNGSYLYSKYKKLLLNLDINKTRSEKFTTIIIGILLLVFCNLDIPPFSIRNVIKLLYFDYKMLYFLLD